MKTIFTYLLFFCGLPVWAQQGTDYLTLLDRLLYSEQSHIRMEIVKNGKLLKSYEMDFFRQGDKMRMEFMAPATEKGRRMLNDNTSLWMYLPRTSKVVKLPFKQSFMGSSASNADLMRMNFSNDYEVTGVEKGDGQTVVLTLVAKDFEVAYNQTKVWFDTGKQVPFRQEMYSLSGKLIKTLLYEEPVQVDGVFIPSVLTIHEELQAHMVTTLYYTAISRKGNKPAEYFTLGALKR